ncbi:MAG TPA: hypothetical protein DDW52_10870 [Planctomycetaceae bacterium]|nr:hypothetical protein [Planctomycetaceae bacterium]
MNQDRRNFFQIAASGSLAATAALGRTASGSGADQIEVLPPRDRVPLSFIIDDSTCLVNMGKFCMPQFAATYPNRKSYQQPWQDWPDEIPDSFVREFGTWCAEHGVKGKYSIVPYPACVGWLDRELPGWSQKDLQQSLKLVRELMVPNWDIHPEMITHTRVIDLETGRPFKDNSPAHMENSYPQTAVSVDYLASYLAYALRILKNCDLPCEGITTPGGFGNLVKDKLPQAVFEAVRDVYGSPQPHYFKYIVEGNKSTLPKLEAERVGGNGTPECCINVLAGTGDWFGGWEGVQTSEPNRYATEDASAGRMIELIQRREPAIMLCHWPGMYCNGSLTGYRAFQRVVKSIKARFGDQTLWMKISDIGKYYAAANYTKLVIQDQTIELNAPYAWPRMTIRIPTASPLPNLRLESGGQVTPILPVNSPLQLKAFTHYRGSKSLTVCCDLPAGKSRLIWSS